MVEQENTNDVNQVVADEGVNTEGVAEPQSDKDRNFTELRERRDVAERRAEEAEARARQYEQVLLEKQTPKQETVEEDDNLDFSDAVDSEAFVKISKRLENKEKKIQQRLDQIEAASRQQSLSAKDPAYLDVINNFLPGVLKENPMVKTIIKEAPPSKQHDLMYQFAVSNPEYVIKKHIEKVKPGGVVEEEKPRVNTLGAMAGGATAVGKESALDMSDDAFYGEGGYLSKVLSNKIR